MMDSDVNAFRPRTKISTGVMPKHRTHRSHRQVYVINCCMSMSVLRGVYRTACAMTPTQVRLSGVRSLSVACGPGIYTFSPFVCVAIYRRGFKAVFVPCAHLQINVAVELLAAAALNKVQDLSYLSTAVYPCCLSLCTIAPPFPDLASAS